MNTLPWLAWFVAIALVFSGAIVLLFSGYLARLALSARVVRERSLSTHWSFDVIVPAHNEEQGITETLESLLALDYPADRVRIVVVADNCTDKTATIARSLGVTVLERTDTTRRGKGYALAHAFAWSALSGRAKAVLVVDADSALSPDSLQVISGCFDAGAHAVQADYRVRNREASWRTQLMDLAFTLHHTVRSLGRTALGWSCGLRGNGMAFRHTTLAQVPYEAFSIVEDIEFGLQLGLAGIPVHYAASAEVRGDMPTEDKEAARSQRARWEVGRRTLRRQWTGRLFRATLSGKPFAGDLLADLLVPPLATLATSIVGGIVLSAFLRFGTPFAVATSSVALLVWLLALCCLLLYGARGVQLASDPAAALRALVYAPKYVAWKLLGRPESDAAQHGEWVRTARPSDS